MSSVIALPAVSSALLSVATCPWLFAIEPVRPVEPPDPTVREAGLSESHAVTAMIVAAMRPKKVLAVRLPMGLVNMLSGHASARRKEIGGRRKEIGAGSRMVR